jgi:hypothetical protein
MIQAIARVPALENTGVKQMINGPESFTPDGNFILGPAPECVQHVRRRRLQCLWHCLGRRRRLGAGQWVIDGEAPIDLWVVDILRFSGLHTDRDNGSTTARWKPMASTTRSAFPMRSMRAGGRASSRRCMTGSRRAGRVRLQAWLGTAQLVCARRHGAARHPFDGPSELVRRRGRRAQGMCARRSVSSISLPLPSMRSGPDALKALDWICANDVTKPSRAPDLHPAAQHARRHRVDLTVARLADDLFYIVTGTGFRTHDAGLDPGAHTQGADVRTSPISPKSGAPCR